MEPGWHQGSPQRGGFGFWGAARPGFSFGAGEQQRSSGCWLDLAEKNMGLGLVGETRHQPKVELQRVQPKKKLKKSEKK